MPKSLADLLAETESVLDVRQTQEQLRSGELQQEDVEFMAPHTPWRDFLTETLLDPSQYLTGGVMGAGFAAKLGKPVLATALRWADPLLGGSEAIGRKLGGETVGKWPVGAKVGTWGQQKSRGARWEPSPEDLMGTPRRGPAGLLETSPIELPPSSLPPSMGPPGTRTLGEMLPLGMRTRPGGLLSERASGRPMGEGTLFPEMVQEPRRFLTAGDVPGELAEDVVNLSNSFSRQVRQPIEELVEAADKAVSRNRLVQEAEKLLIKKTEGVIGIRRGKIDKSGGYFSTPGSSTYFDLEGKGVEQYNLSGVKIANTEDLNVTKSVLQQALKDSGNTPEDIKRLKQALVDGHIDYLINDEVPSLVKAAKKLGYGGIKVWENDDWVSPSSVFIWDTKVISKRKPPIQGSPTEPESTLVLTNNQIRDRIEKASSLTELKKIAAERGISPRNFTKEELKQYILKNLERQEGYERLSRPEKKSPFGG